jgi:hypothetical protein
MLTPIRPGKRLKVEIDQDGFQKILRMNRSGVWDANTVNNNTLRSEFSFASHGESITEQLVNGKKFVLWSDDE